MIRFWRVVYPSEDRQTLDQVNQMTVSLRHQFVLIPTKVRRRMRQFLGLNFSKDLRTQNSKTIVDCLKPSIVSPL